MGDLVGASVVNGLGYVETVDEVVDEIIDVRGGGVGVPEIGVSCVALVTGGVLVVCNGGGVCVV